MRLIDGKRRVAGSKLSRTHGLKRFHQCRQAHFVVSL
jgi:hypothetical protein